MNKIPLTKDGAIRKTLSKALPNLPYDLDTGIISVVQPDNTVREVQSFTFYCNSVKKTGGLWYNDQVLNTSGDGSAKNPWIDLNYALQYLQCLMSSCCVDCFAFVLKLSGTVNYFVGAITSPGSIGDVIDGQGNIIIDCTDANFRYDSYMYYYIAYITGVTFIGIDFECSVADMVDVHAHSYIFYELEYCRVADFKRLSIEWKDCHIINSSGISIAFRCTDCVFTGEVARLALFVASCDAGNIGIHGFTGANCFFSIKEIELYGNETPDLTIYYSLGGISDTTDSVLQDCHVTYTGQTAYISGCAFSGNENVTWLGENVGFEVRSLGHLQGIVFRPDALLNEDCSHYPIEPSSSEPPSSSVVPPSSEEPPSSSGIPPSSSEPPSSSSSSSGVVSHKGSILCHAFTRSTSYSIWATVSDYDYVNGKQRCYVVSTTFDSTATSATVSLTNYYGYIGTLDCEKLIDVDENGNEVSSWDCWGECYCSDGRFIANDGVTVHEKPASLADSAASDANIDVTKWINGTLYELPEPTDIPVDKTGWFGFKNYTRSGSLHHISPHRLDKEGDTLTVNTKTEASFYSNWGERPCFYGDGWGIITLDTYVFEWRPEDENDKAKPKYCILEDADGNEIKCDFMTEYCLQGNEDIDRDMLSLTTCNSVFGVDVDDHCNLVVVKGTTKSYDSTKPGVTTGWEDDYQRPTCKLSRTYTLKSVKF